MTPTDHDHDTADHGDDAPKRAPEGSQAGVLNDFDQTNGLVDGLGGDDEGAEETTTDRTEEMADGVLPAGQTNTSSGAVAPVPGTTDAEAANTDEDADPAVTSYSEEGRR